MSKRLAFAVTATLLCAGAAAQQAPLPRPVLERAAAAGIAAENIGALVRRVGSQEPLVAWQADRPFAPGSTLKLLTSIVALESLGPDYRARTELRGEGSRRGDTWRGDIVLKGMGDPDFDLEALQHMLRRLRAMGVRRIDGDLVLDRSFFDPPRTDVTLPAFDEAPEFRYNVIPDSLAFGMNLVHLEVASDAKRVAIEAHPALPGVTFRSAMTLVDVPCREWEPLWRVPVVTASRNGAIVATLQGEFPRGCNVGTDINVIERNEYVGRSFRAAWTAMGGRFAGRAREGLATPASILLAEHRSRALSELAWDIEKRSDNPVTRMTFLALGARAPGKGNTVAKAERVVREWLAARRIPDAGLVLENGSGLSRIERITPETLAGVIEAAMASRWWYEFAASLPIAGVDGGLGSRLRDTPAAGVARLKTGTLRDVAALAGFVDGPGGRHVVVVVVNDATAGKSEARAVLDALVEWVARGGPAEAR